MGLLQKFADANTIRGLVCPVGRGALSVSARHLRGRPAVAQHEIALAAAGFQEVMRLKVAARVRVQIAAEFLLARRRRVLGAAA
nr:hypothetical protein [Amycolatopsis australiensis]